MLDRGYIVLVQQCKEALTVKSRKYILPRFHIRLLSTLLIQYISVSLQQQERTRVLDATGPLRLLVCSTGTRPHLGQ